MSLRDYTSLLRRRWRLVALGAVLGTLLGVGASVATTRMYESSARLLVTLARAQDSTSALLAPNLLTQEQIASYAELANGPDVANAVVRDLGLNESPSAVASRITASVPAQTVLIQITASDHNPVRAQRIAQAAGAETARLIERLEAPGSHAKSPVIARIAQPASIPGSPSSPSTARDVALGLLIGLALGFGAALIREALDSRIRDMEDLESLGLPALGAVVADRSLRNKPVVAPAVLPDVVAESFRQIRTNLQFLDGGQPPRSLLVASSLPEEGKSMTAWNLAIAFAEAGEHVTVVEADLRRPTLSNRYLDLGRREGLSEVLIRKRSIDEVSISWMDGRLRLIPAGTPPPNPGELLSSRTMHELLQSLTDGGDIVLVDAPPLLPFADAAVIAGNVEATIFIARAGKARLGHARRAGQLLSAVNAHVCGAILTMAPRRGPGAEDYSYHGYGYGYRHSHTRERSAGAVAADE